MQRAEIPANISLLDLSASRVAALKPVRVLDIFDGGTMGNFHEEGLFSVSIFGRVGSDERDLKFSFIDLRTEIFHPFVYDQICDLKALYKGIINGKAYAEWDDKDKDFIASDNLKGDTGYHFFMSHWRDIKFKRTSSDRRDLKIAMIEKYKPLATTTRVAVMPAGLRDIQIDGNERVKQSEVNDFYRTLISISNSLSNNVKVSSILDTTRLAMQLAFNKIFEYINNLLKGKNGFMQAKWGSRRIFNGTRNVITAMDTSPAILGESNSPKYNNTVLGFYQVLKGMLPVSQHLLLTGYVSKIFNGADGSAMLVNPASLKRERVTLAPETVDQWTTSAGAEKVINSYYEPNNRLSPIKVEGYYLGLIYRGPDKTFKIFGDIDELPTDGTFSRDDVHPISLGELLYLSGYLRWNKTPLYLTRYPITGAGSIYPSWVYVKLTDRAEIRYELGEDWTRKGDEFKALEYPLFDNPAYVDSLYPHPSRLSGLGGDFDGDTASANLLYLDESIAEVTERLKDPSAYLDVRGGLSASGAVMTVDRVLFNMTGD